MLLEKEVNDGSTHNTVTKYTCSTRLCPSREWRIVFVLGSDHIAAAFWTFFFHLFNITCLLQDPDSEVTAVAFKSPAFFAVVLDV